MIYEVNPVTTITAPERSIPILLALGSAAGFGIGIHRARSIELERTRSRLDDQIRALEAANDRFEQFTYAISHDLRQPMRTLTSYLQLLRRRHSDELNDDARQLLDHALDGAMRTRALLDGLLQFTQVNSIDPEFSRIDCNELIEGVLSDLKLTIDDHAASIMVDDLPTVSGDERLLRLLFQNLIENAIKYCEDEPTIEIYGEADANMQCISISDNGIGIAEDELGQIFDLFHRGREHSTAQGTGLGLALCERIITIHSGEIRVGSVVGEGSTFEVRLPNAGNIGTQESSETTHNPSPKTSSQIANVR